MARAAPVFRPAAGAGGAQNGSALAVGPLAIARPGIRAGSDILCTTIAPTWDEIGKLAAIVVLRTLLNYFLEREIHMVDTPVRGQK